MRNPQTEYNDGIGAGRPGRETIARQRRPVDIGRYSQRGPDAATRRMRAGLAEISDLEHRRMILRQLELDALR